PFEWMSNCLTSGLLPVEATDLYARPAYSPGHEGPNFRASRAGTAPWQDRRVTDDADEAGVARRETDPATTVRANRGWWDGDADDYQAEHGAFLGDADFVWCPERLREADAHLLGDVRGRDVLEVGCGAAMCARWLATRGARPIALDLSAGMLRHARAGNQRTGIAVPL